MPTSVLIVDDSERMRDSIRVLIESHPGLEVCGEAEDGVEAISKAERLKPDLVILDLVMPKLNGVETASVLKGMFPNLPIVLFTMFESAADALGPALGVDVVLSKPEGFDDLLGRLRGLSDSRPQ